MHHSRTEAGFVPWVSAAGFSLPYFATSAALVGGGLRQSCGISAICSCKKMAEAPSKLPLARF